MLTEPLKAVQARAVISSILEAGNVAYSRHFVLRLGEHGMTMVDAANVLRAGIVQEAEWENGSWRHQVRTGRMVVVIAFRSEAELVCVTAWRLQ